jgi:hypothetical protein
VIALRSRSSGSIQRFISRSSLAAFLLVGTGLMACATAESGRPADPDGYGAWMEKDPGDWPRITMINQIEYTDAQHPTAACGFLLDAGDEILAATAKHVLIYFKSKDMDSVSFGDSLVSWRMFPKDRPEDRVLIDRLINEDPQEPLTRIPSPRDWLLFTIRERSEAIQPLRLRSTPLQAGEKVFVIGWRYPDEGRQHVHEGQFVRIDEGAVLVSIDALADNTIPGLSGSPVIDGAGYVIGLMSTKFGKLQRLAPADYPRTLIERRRQAANPD